LIPCLKLLTYRYRNGPINSGNGWITNEPFQEKELRINGPDITIEMVAI